MPINSVQSRHERGVNVENGNSSLARKERVKSPLAKGMNSKEVANGTSEALDKAPRTRLCISFYFFAYIEPF